MHLFTNYANYNFIFPVFLWIRNLNIDFTWAAGFTRTGIREFNPRMRSNPFHLFLTRTFPPVFNMSTVYGTHYIVTLLDGYSLSEPEPVSGLQ